LYLVATVEVAWLLVALAIWGMPDGLAYFAFPLVPLVLLGVAVGVVSGVRRNR
jgi:hypothetical protein